MTTNPKTPSVKLKGVGNSLWVTLDPTQPIDLIQDELLKLFGRFKHLTTQARVILDPGVPEGHENLIEGLSNFLKESFGVGFVSGPLRKGRLKRSGGEKRILSIHGKIVEARYLCWLVG